MNVSSTDYFDTMLYGPRDNATSDMFRGAAASLANIIPQQYSDMLQTIQQRVEYVNSDRLRDLGASLVARVGSLWKGDSIRALENEHDLACAPISMQRWIMAQPTVRKVYHKQKCDGYSDTYVDIHPGVVGNDHVDYRNVVHGVIMDTDEYDDYVTVYHSDMDQDGYADLTMANKADILTTWKEVECAIKRNNVDPTSPFLTYL